MERNRQLFACSGASAVTLTEIDFYAITDLKMASGGNDVVSYYLLFMPTKY